MVHRFQQDLLKAVAVKDSKTGEVKDLPVNGLFYAIGHDPATSLVRDQLEVDSDGYIKTVPGTSQTSVKGVFAAGDVQDKKFRQAITSAGTGCIAALECERLLAEEEVEDTTGEPHVPGTHTYLGVSSTTPADDDHPLSAPPPASPLKKRRVD
jgi:thioredoxin reductase (NADPH)